MTREELAAIVFKYLQERIDHPRPRSKHAVVELGEETELLRHDDFMDSLGLVELCLDVEMEVEERWGMKVDLLEMGAKDDALLHESSPFRTVGTYIDFCMRRYGLAD